MNDDIEDLLDTIERLLHTVKVQTHLSAASAAEDALAELRRRLSDQGNRIGLDQARAEFYEADIRRRDTENLRLLAEIEKVKDTSATEINRLYRVLDDARAETVANALPIRPPGRYRDTDGAVGTIGPPHVAFGKIFQVFYVDRDDQHVPFEERMLEYLTLTTDEAQRLVLIGPETKWGEFRL